MPQLMLVTGVGHNPVGVGPGSVVVVLRKVSAYFIISRAQWATYDDLVVVVVVVVVLVQDEGSLEILFVSVMPREAEIQTYEVTVLVVVRVTLAVEI